MQRGLLVAWTAGFAIAGAFFGMLARSIPDLSATGDAVGEFLRRYAGGPGADATDAYLWMIALSLGYTAALYPMLAMLRVRAEESSGTAELLLSTPVSRMRHIAAHLLIGTVGTVVILATAGLTIMKLDYWIANLTVPFHHLPKVLSGEALRVTPIAVLTLLAVALALFGVIGYRRRDIA